MIETFLREMDFADAKINTIDGVRVTIDGAWGLLRASNTSPKFVLDLKAILRTACYQYKKGLSKI